MPSVLPGYHKERDDVCVCNAKAHLCQPELQQVCEMYWELNTMMVSERQVGIWGGGTEGKGKVWEERNFSNTMHQGWRDTKTALGERGPREMAEQGTGTCQTASLALCSSGLAAANPAPTWTHRSLVLSALPDHWSVTARANTLTPFCLSLD